MPRYNMRTLRGERVIKKKEGVRMKRWETNYERIINDTKNVLTVQKVMEEIAQTFKNNAIEQEKVSLICPLTKERIVTPVRYRTCRHFQCFDLKGFFSMKAKRNFLECPICNSKLDNELDGLCIDKYFQKILSEVIGSTEIEILCDSTFRAALTQSVLLIPKVIDDEEPYAPDHSTTHIGEIKSETDSNVGDIEELGSVANFDIDNEANKSDAETQNVLVPDAYMANDWQSVQAENSTTKKAVRPKIDEKQFNSGNCSCSTKNKNRFLINNRTHTVEKPFKWNQCSYASAIADSLKLHTVTHTGKNLYKCSQCSYASAQPRDLKRHMRTHTGEQLFKCSQCSYGSARADNLKNHMRTHTGEKPYNCNQCPYASSQASVLKTHIRTHTGEKPYKCNRCCYASAESGHLKRHMFTHTDEKPHKCDQCSYACTTSGALKKHMRTHIGEKPYKCDQCPYASARSGYLKTHIRTHTGEKPYKCNQCCYASAESGHLKRHMFTHTDEKPHKCDQCSYACTTSGALKKHMLTHS